MTVPTSTEVQVDQIERIVLGSLMLQPAVIDDVSEILTTGDFYRPANAAIYAAIIAAAALGEPTDPLPIALKLEAFGELNRVGGVEYLHTCVASVPTVASATWYARQVAERAYARRTAEAALKLQHVAETGDRARIQAAYEQLQKDLAVAPDGGAGIGARLVNGASFIFDVPDKVPAVWGDGDDVLWASGESLIICGGQGVGKTTLAGQIIVARLGLTNRVLDWPVAPTQRRILYLAMDRPQQAARSLRRVARPEWYDTIYDRLSIWTGPPPEDFAVSPTVLLEMCRAANADTVIIDSVKDAAIGLSKDEVGAGYNRARQTAIAGGVEVLELHHQRKTGEGGGKPRSISDVYGSTWIPSGAGSVVLLWGDPGDSVVEFVHLKQPLNDVGPLMVLHDHERGVSEIDRGDFTKDLIYLTGRQPHGMTPKAAAQALFGATERNDVEKARRKLEAYVKAGVMMRRDGSRGGGPDREQATYFLVENREVDR